MFCLDVCSMCWSVPACISVVMCLRNLVWVLKIQITSAEHGKVKTTPNTRLPIFVQLFDNYGQYFGVSKHNHCSAGHIVYLFVLVFCQDFLPVLFSMWFNSSICHHKPDQFKTYIQFESQTYSISYSIHCFGKCIPQFPAQPAVHQFRRTISLSWKIQVYWTRIQIRQAKLEH